MADVDDLFDCFEAVGGNELVPVPTVVPEEKANLPLPIEIANDFNKDEDPDR